MVTSSYYRNKWIEALRSGEYKQARRFLRTDAGHCCLGVACDVVKPDGWEPNHSFQGEIAHLPASVVLAIGINYNALNTIMRMNDEQGKSFTEIADYIEANYEEVFRDPAPDA